MSEVDRAVEHRTVLRLECRIADLEKAIEAATLAEREACAKVCDELRNMYHCVDVCFAAEAIRARSTG